MSFALLPGWNDIDQPIVRSGAIGKAWAGGMVGLRLALGAPSGRTQVHLDSLRVYHPLSTSAITWAAPGTSAATLWWTDSAGVISAIKGQCPRRSGQGAGRVRIAGRSGCPPTPTSTR